MGELVVATAVFLTSWLILRIWREVSSKSGPGKRLPPCLPSLPIVGSLPFIPFDVNILHIFLTEQTSKYGNIYCFYMGARLVVVLNGAKVIRDALLKRSTEFAGRCLSTDAMFINTHRKGIITAPYDANFRWKHKLYLSILKQFGFGQRLMETRINAEVEDLVHQLRLTDRHPFDPKKLLAGSLLNVIGSIIFGRRYQRDSDRQVALLKGLHDYTSGVNILVLMFPTLRFLPHLRKKLEIAVHNSKRFLDLLTEEVDKTLADNASDDNCGDSFVRQFVLASKTELMKSSMLESGAKLIETSENANETILSREELHFTVRDLIAAGTDTSVQTQRWLLAELANHPIEQARLQDEIDKVIGRERLPSLDDEASMPYAQAVILEIMRRRTLVPRSIIHETIRDTYVGDHFIPAHTLVITNLYSVHMDPKLWEEPEIFRPERFISDKGQIVNKDQVIPFSLGKRSCTGELLARQEAFLFLTGIFQNFTILPPENEDKLDLKASTPVIHEAEPFCVRAIPRS